MAGAFNSSSFSYECSIRYMGHPNAKVARASHSLFVAFLTSGEDSFEDEQASLKEQFSYYYVQRSLEVLLVCKSSQEEYISAPKTFK